jgi:hypothetical protein
MGILPQRLPPAKVTTRAGFLDRANTDCVFTMLALCALQQQVRLHGNNGRCTKHRVFARAAAMPHELRQNC